MIEKEVKILWLHKSHNSTSSQNKTRITVSSSSSCCGVQFSLPLFGVIVRNDTEARLNQRRVEPESAVRLLTYITKNFSFWDYIIFVSRSCLRRRCRRGSGYLVNRLDCACSLTSSRFMHLWTWSNVTSTNKQSSTVWCFWTQAADTRKRSGGGGHFCLLWSHRMTRARTNRFTHKYLLLLFLALSEPLPLC